MSETKPRKINNFSPRPYQLPILKALDQGYKRVLAIMPRRAGKDITALNYVIRRMWEEPGVYYYIFPTYSQAKKVIWDSITNTGQKVLDYFPDELVMQKNAQEMKIRMKTKNGSESLFQLIGSDNYDALMGTNPRGCVFSEYALQDPMAYQYIRPILTANKGWALFISTPRGKNHLWTLAELARVSPDWFFLHLSIEDTNHISLEDIEKERRDGLMSEDMIQQEYYCFPAGTEVMTSDSMCPIESIRPDQLVVSHTGRTRAVLDTVSRPYQGELVSIKTAGHYKPILCTPNHPVRVYLQETQTYGWKQAGDICPQDWVCFPKRPMGQLPLMPKSLVMLLAWYICDGSSFNNGLQFTVRTGSKQQRVEELLCSLNLPYTSFKGEGCVHLVVNDTRLVDFFKSSCGHRSHNKVIPFNLISGYEDEFFHELMKGDGCVPKDARAYLFSTTSKALAYQVQQLAISITGPYTAAIAYRAPGSVTFDHGTYDTKESFNVVVYHYNRMRKAHSLRRSKYCMVANVKEVTSVPYTGDVYNLKVQYDESYTADGRAVHNCSFDMGIEGAYYARYLDEARRQQRIGDVPWENGFLVHTAWDLGVRDSTSIIFFQTIGQTVRVIDYYENSKQGLEHYVNVLQSKPYTYGKHIAPHDIRVREFTSGTTRIEKARQLGINFIIADEVSIPDGIEAVRSLISKLWFNEETTKPLVKALENYRQEYDQKKKIYRPRPLHDWSSHAADAARYLAVSLPKTRDSLSPEDLDRRYNEAVYGTQTNIPPQLQQPHVR